MREHSGTSNTVEPPIMDTGKSTKRSPTAFDHIPPRKGQHLHNGQNTCVRYIRRFCCIHYFLFPYIDVVLCGIFVFVEATEIHRGPDVAEDIIGSGGHLVTHHMSWPKIVVYTAQVF